jgi:hypothetical protein
MSADIIISPHFTYDELTATSVRGLSNAPTDEQVKNLRYLAEQVLEHVRAIFGALYTTSAYRSPAVNQVVGGSATSMHPKGCAWDGVPLRPVKWGNVIEYLRGREDLPIDQVIYEFGRWIHIGTRPSGIGCRREFLMVFNTGKYEPWNARDPRITR